MKFRFIDTWSSAFGSHSEEIGVFEAENIEKAIEKASSKSYQVRRDCKPTKVSDKKWTVLGNSCPHFITIHEI